MLRQAVIACMFLCASAAAWAVEVIAHPAVAANSLGLPVARAMFGMRQVKWPDGSLVRVFVLPDAHPTHVAVCKNQLNLYPYQLRQSWDRLVYSGMAQAPTVVADEAEMLARVASTPGAIGYLSRAQINDKIRVLHVD